MTVIVCRDGIMAADSGVWQGSIVVGRTRKVHRLSDGRLFAGCGERSLTIACRKWLDGETECPASVSDGSFSALILGHDGVLRVNNRFAIYESASHEFAVDGAHQELLIGALAAGASAEQAVRIAIQYGDSAAGEVHAERL